jgi:peroxiredoxin Q/BCP
MLVVGSRAPEFTLPDQDGRDVSLTDLLNRGPLILYFYPADFTPGCTRQACTISHTYSEILAAGMTVAGISPQGSKRHQAFRERYKLPFTLLSDADKLVIGMYEASGLFGRVRRVTYLIDPGRSIRDAVMADFRIGVHEAFIRRVLSTRA